MKTKMIHYIETKLLNDLPQFKYFILAEDYDKDNARVYTIFSTVVEGGKVIEYHVVYIGGGTRDDDSCGIKEILSGDTKVHVVSIKGITFAV